jgi:DNA adenine methylase
MSKLTAVISPLKYAGSKRWLAPLLTPLIKEIKPKVVCEPFAGSLAFSLFHKFDKVLANDLNPFLINFYIQIIKGMSYSTNDYDNSEKFYYEVRERVRYLNRNNQVNNMEAAKLFFFINKQGYKGLWRCNASDELNTPYGHYKKLSELERAEELKSNINGWDFISGTYQDIDTSSADLNFIDPPYLENFTNYTAQSFKLPEQLELIKWSANQNKPTIYCNSAKHTIARACKNAGFSVYKINAPRSIGAHSSNNVKSIPELIAFKGFGNNRKFSTIIDGAKRWRMNIQ